MSVRIRTVLCFPPTTQKFGVPDGYADVQPLDLALGSWVLISISLEHESHLRWPSSWLRYRSFRRNDRSGLDAVVPFPRILIVTIVESLGCWSVQFP